MQARPAKRSGMRVGELGEEVVVDPDHLDGGLGVGHARARAEDAVEHLGLHAVAVLVLQAELRIAQPPDPALAVLVEPRRGHAVRAVDLPGHVLAAGRPHAVGEAELPALLRDPHGALGALGDIGHAVAQRGGRAAREEIGGKPAKVQVAVGGDALVVHTSSRVGGGHARPGRPSRPGAGSVGIIRDRCQTSSSIGSSTKTVYRRGRPRPASSGSTYMIELCPRMARGRP